MLFESHTVDVNILSPEMPFQNLMNTVRYSQPTIALSTGSPMEELEKGLKELKGFATP